MVAIGDWLDDDHWYLLDLRKQCIRYEVILRRAGNAPLTSNMSPTRSSNLQTVPKLFKMRSVAMINERVVACGGQESDDSISSECHDFHPSDGWTRIGDYPMDV